MDKSQKNSQVSLMLTLGLISIFLMLTLVTQLPRNISPGELSSNDAVLADAPEPTDTPDFEGPTATPRASSTARASATASASPLVIATGTPTATAFTFTPAPTTTPVPTFNLNLPGDTETAKPVVTAPKASGTNNTGLIIAAIVGTLLFLGGVAFLIISRRKSSNDFGVPPTTPNTQTVYPTNTNYMNTTPQPFDSNQQGQAGYTTPFDQYTNPNIQGGQDNSGNPPQGQ
jgi:hypothetical protein